MTTESTYNQYIRKANKLSILIDEAVERPEKLLYKFQWLCNHVPVDRRDEIRATQNW